MFNRIALLSLVAASLALSGCVVVREKGGTTSKKSGLSSPAAQCDNNQYWDGTMCRHKGKGHGARKHDG